MRIFPFPARYTSDRTSIGLTDSRFESNYSQRYPVRLTDVSRRSKSQTRMNFAVLATAALAASAATVAVLASAAVIPIENETGE